MSYRATDPPRGQQGAALVVAMLVFALVAALMVGLQRDFTLTLQRGTHQLFSEQTWSYLIGAEGLAQIALQRDTRIDAEAESPADHLGEMWAQPPTPYPLDAGGWMTGGLEDLQGRLNLNGLIEAPTNSANKDEGVEAENEADDAVDAPAEPVAPATVNSNDAEKRWSVTQKLLIRLLQALGDASLSLDDAMVLTERITDFIDADTDRRLEGAEGPDYRYASFPYLPANQPLASVSELRAVQGMTATVYDALAPLVTVWPVASSRLNILTCPLAVLQALNGDDQLSPLPAMEAERLDALRREGDITQVEDLLSDSVFEGQALTELQPLLDVRSDWFLLDASVELAERERHLFTVFHRTPERVVAVFRSEGEL
jgi:general secretion pathway protein K